MRPGGRYAAADMYDAGGVALVMRELLKRDLLDGDAKTVDGRTIAKIAADVVETPGQQVVHPIETPIKETGGLTILHGTPRRGGLRREAGRPRAAPPPRPGPRVRQRGRVLRGRPRPTASSPATSSSSATRAPSAVPACRRCSASPARSSARGSATGRAPHRRPLLGRHPRPDDRPRGARGRARRADRASSRRATRSRSTWTARPLDLLVDADELERRRAAWSPPAPRYTSGVMAKYAALVSSASEGAVTTGPRLRVELTSR